MRRRSADFRQYHKRCTRFTQTLHKGAPFFAEPQRGGIRRLRTAGTSRRPPRGSAAPAAGAKRKDNLRLSFLFGLLPFPCWDSLGADGRLRKQEKDAAEDFFSATDELPSESVLLSNLFAVSDTLLLHMRFTLRRRDIPVSRKSLARCNARHLRIRHLVQFTFVGAVYHNALTSCAALSCRACWK